MTQKQKIQFLGYSGLIPFVMLLIFSLFEKEEMKSFFEPQVFFSIYSLCIYTFLTGSIWAMSIKERKEPSYPILLFFLPLLIETGLSFLINPYASLILALLFSFMVLYVYEAKTFEQENFYKQMRFRLTVIVIISHIGILITN